MPLFPSLEWAEALKEVINSDPEIRKAGQDFEADAVIVIEPGNVLKEPFIVYVKGVNGVVEEVRRLNSADEVPAKFVVSSDYHTWKAIIRGELDGVKAVLMGKVKLKGDMREVLKRAKDQQLMMKALTKVDTQFPDEGG